MLRAPSHGEEPRLDSRRSQEGSSPAGEDFPLSLSGPPPQRGHGAGGLSTSHICTWAVRGSFFHLSGIPYQGEVVRGKRGKVKGFSVGSRLRMMTSLAIIDQGKAGLPSWFHLTYPDEMPIWPIPESKVKRDLRVFRLRVERQFGKRAMLWRRENEARKSGTHQGQAGPHVHVLVWNLEPTRENQCWLSDNWFEVVGSGEEKHRRAGTRWTRFNSWYQVRAYVSKYVAKVEELETEGRCWGWWNRELVPATLMSEEILRDAFYQVRRVLRRYLEKKTGRRCRVRDRSSGLSVFLPDPWGRKLIAWAWDIAWWEGSGES